MKNTTYHQTSPTVTAMLPVAIKVLPFGTVLVTATTIYLMSVDPRDIGNILGCIVSPILLFITYYGRKTAYNQFSVCEFDGSQIIFKRFDGEEMYRYFKTHVSDLKFVEAKWLKSNAPHIELTFKDGKKILFNREMAFYRSFADDIEEWTGIKLPNKEERLKYRDDNAMNGYYP